MQALSRGVGKHYQVIERLLRFPNVYLGKPDLLPAFAPLLLQFPVSILLHVSSEPVLDMIAARAPKRGLPGAG